jgi:hypothetical protein
MACATFTLSPDFRAEISYTPRHVRNLDDRAGNRLADLQDDNGACQDMVK